MKLFKIFFIATLVILTLNSCKNDDGGGPLDTTQNVTINLISPQGIEITQYNDASIRLVEINTGTESNETITGSTLNVTLEQGSYEISVNGSILYTFDNTSLEGGITAYQNQVAVTEETESIDIPLILKSSQNDLIIEEIFFTGNITPEGSSYLGDKYFKIYNNTEQTLYADGLLLAQSAFLTVDQQEYTPDVMSEAFTAEAIIVLPGSGEDYPIESGKSIIIASEAINHLEYNANSIDLTTADFEIYNEPMGDVDNPSVPNAISLYNNIIIHSRGFKSYVIARLPEGMTNEAFLTEYSYIYSYDFVFNGETYPFEDPGVMIPNEYIVDAVNLSVASEFQWIITDPSLDAGWTYCGTVDADESRFGKSVQRKVVSSENGFNILQDTNNSTVDFNPEVRASLLN